MDQYEIIKVECLRYKLIILTPDVYRAEDQIYWFENDQLQFSLENKIATLVVKNGTNSIKEAKQTAQEYITGIETLGI
jgi:hypothetical protein